MKKLIKKYFQEFGFRWGPLVICAFIVLTAQLINQIYEKDWFMIILDSIVAAFVLIVVIYKLKGK